MTRFNPQKIHSHLSYTVEQLAEVFEIVPKTCRRWIIDGLPTVPGSKSPLLIMGNEIKRFLQVRNLKHRKKLKSHEFYCFKCKAARRAKQGSIVTSGNMKKAICSICGGKIRKTFKPHQKDYSITSPPVQMSIFNN